VLIAGDDVVFHEGWEVAVEVASEAGARVVGTSDLTRATADGTHATMPIVSRDYIDTIGGAYGEPGNVLHEGYHHNFAEIELCALAEHRGRWQFVPDAIIEHRHPSWGAAEVDETSLKGGLGPHWDRDSALYEERRALWQG
jgi:hypothetical protein